MEAPSLQTVIETKYSIKEEINVEGKFITLQGRKIDHYLVCLGIGERFLIIAKVENRQTGLNYELVSLLPLSVLTFSWHSGSRRLQVCHPGNVTQVFQFICSVQQDKLWDSVIFHLKNHFSDTAWLEETTRFPKQSSNGRIVYDDYYVSFLNEVLTPYNERLLQNVRAGNNVRSGTGPTLRRCSSIGNVLPSGNVNDTSFQPLKRTKSEPCIKYAAVTKDKLMSEDCDSLDGVTCPPYYIPFEEDVVEDGNQDLNRSNNVYIPKVSLAEEIVHQKKSRKKKQNIAKKLLYMLIPCVPRRKRNVSKTCSH